MKTSVYFLMARSLALLCAVALLGGAAPTNAASGRIFVFTSNPALEDTTNNFGGFLRGLGYTVTVLQNPGASPYELLDVIGTTNAEYQAQLIAELTSDYDLIIIHRNYGSGTLASSAAEIAIWNQLNVPILMANAPIARNNRWRWINSANSGSAPADRHLSIVAPDHPIVAGLESDLFAANRSYGGVIDAFDGGTNMVTVAKALVPGFNVTCLAAWDAEPGVERGFYEGSGQTYTQRRVFFEMHEYRNGGDWSEITPNGRRMWANAVGYTMTGQVPPWAPAIMEITPADGSAFNQTATTFSFRTTSAQPIPTSGIQVVVNGQDVSGSLQFTGSANNRTVNYPALVPNELYNVSITVSNVDGVSTAASQFDTFVPTDVPVLPPDIEGNFSDWLFDSAWRVFLRVQSQTAQIVSLSQSNAIELPPVTRLKGVFYLPGGMSTNRLVPLTDALGQQTVLRTPEGIVSFLLGARTNVDLFSLLLVPATAAPGTLAPSLARATPFPGQQNVSVSAALDLDLVDADSAVVPGSIRLWLDGVDLTGAAETSVTDTPSGATVRYTPPNFIAPSQTHTVRVVCSDTAEPPRSLTNTYTFSTVQMAAIPPSLAVGLDGATNRGFNLRLHFAPDNTDPVFTNTSARAEAQLAGLLAGPSGPVTNQISGTTSSSAYAEPGTLNYNATAATTGQIPGDTLFPFGDTVTPSHVAFEATTYLELPAGILRLGVASDDGFRLTAGHDGSVFLGAYEGTRGDQVPTEFQVLVYQPGVYPIRLVHYDGGGSASLEFYSIHDTAVSPSTGGRVLINGQDIEGTVQVPAYQAAPPRLSITREGDEIVLRWHGSGGFALQASPSLDAPEWTPVSQLPAVQGWLHTVRLQPAPEGNSFYRLTLQP